MLTEITVLNRIFIARWRVIPHLDILCLFELISSRLSCLLGIELGFFLHPAKDWRAAQPHILSMAYFEPSPVISSFLLTVLQYWSEAASCWWWGTWLPNSTLNYCQEHEWPYRFIPCCAIVWHSHRTFQISVFPDDICSTTLYINDWYLPRKTVDLWFADATTKFIYLLIKEIKLKLWLRQVQDDWSFVTKPYIFVIIFYKDEHELISIISSFQLGISYFALKVRIFPLRVGTSYFPFL